MSFYDRNKQLVDQSAHFAVALVVTMIIGHFLGWLIGVGTTMFAATMRELAQHGWDPDDFKMGTVIDLTFFAIGSIAGAAILGLIS